MYDQRYLARKGRAGERFGPDVKAVAKTLFVNLALCPHVLEVLKQIDAEHPTLTFADFLDAVRLADIIERQRGNA
jgi:hypothetical protein